MVIVEDHAMVAEALAAAVQLETDIVVAAVGGTLREGLAAIALEQPDVVLLDYRLPDGNAIAAVAGMRQAAPDAALLLLTAEPSAAVAAAAIDAGCAGLVPKGERIHDVIAAIRAVQGGGSVYAPDLLLEAMRARQTPSGDPEELTQREREILRLLAEGIGTRAIAEQLVVSVHTVRNHVRHIIAKLGATSRLEALAVARARGVLHDEAADSGQQA